MNKSNNKYTPLKKAKRYAPDKQSVDKMGKVVFGNKMKDNPKGKGRRNNV